MLTRERTVIKMQLQQGAVRLAAVALLAVPWPAHAADAPATPAAAPSEEAAEISALRAQIEALDQKLRVLERKQEIQQEAAAAAAQTAPVVRAGSDRLSLASTNGDNSIRFRALLNVDYHNFRNTLAPNGTALPPGSTGFLLRQVRPYVEGTLGGFVDYRIMPDFAGGKTVLQDAFATARFNPYFQLTAGKFKSPLGLERLQSDSDNRFVERALPDRLIPNRDIGVQLGGELLGGKLSYQAAYLNGTADGSSADSNTSPDTDNNDDKDLVLRLFALPFRDSQLFALRGLGVGVGASYVDANGTTDATGAAVQSLLPSYRTNGQQIFFSYRGGTTPTIAYGERQRVSPQAYYYYGPFGFLGEYAAVRQEVRRVNGASVRQDSLKHSAWQTQFTWFLTGEDSGYRVPAPHRPFTLGGPGWGSVELAARYAELSIDDAAFAGGANSFANPLGSASKARAWTVGVNWALTQNFKTVVDYEKTDFEGGAANGADAPSESLWFGRFQFQY
jgi:phosphate-selective porin OprO and OprP